MAITIKKSKLTLKAPVADTALAPEISLARDTMADISDEPASKNKYGDFIFQIVGLVFALLAVILFVALIFMQLTEISYYKDAIPEYVPHPASAVHVSAALAPSAVHASAAPVTSNAAAALPGVAAPAPAAGTNVPAPGAAAATPK